MKSHAEKAGHGRAAAKAGPAAKAPKAFDLGVIYRDAVRSRVLDGRLESWMRLGQLGFSFPALAWGGVLAAVAAALRPDDWLFPSAREARMALWRGMPLEDFLAQHLGRELTGEGSRSLPAFPGGIADVAHHVASVPGGPAAHFPQAVGAAQAFALRKAPGAVLALCSGAAVDEPDFHVALNFAGVWKVPVVFAVRLEAEDSAFDAAARGAAYGIEGALVDGAELEHVVKAVGGALVAGKPALVAIGCPPGDDGGLASLRRKLGNGSRPDDAALTVFAEQWCDAAMEKARAAKLPAPATLTDAVFAAPPLALHDELAVVLGGPAIPEDA